jgi:uncharacterized protein YegP (UPF0339 family)
MAEFLVYQNEQGEFHWYLVADDGAKIAGSEKGFATRDACERTIQAVKQSAATAPVTDRTHEEKLEEVQLREVGAVPATRG